MKTRFMTWLGVCLLLLLNCSCANQSLSVTEPIHMTVSPSIPTPAPDIPTINKLARITMPASASDLIATVYPGGIDSAVYLRFQLPQKDLALFLKNAGYSTPLKERNYVLVSQFESWWPDRESYTGSKKKFWGLEIDEPGFVRRILVEEISSDTRLIYLEHFEV